MLEDGKAYVFYLKGTSKVLDVCGAGTENETNIQIYDYERVPQQIFQAIKYDKYYMFKDINSGKIIDLKESKVENGTNIQIFEKNNSDNQKWLVVDDGNGYYLLCSKLNPNFCIDVKFGNTSNGTNVWLYEKNYTNSQKFRIVLKEIYPYKVGTKLLLGNDPAVKNVTHAAFLIGNDLFEYGTQQRALISSAIRYLRIDSNLTYEKVEKQIKKIFEEKGIKYIRPHGFVRRKYNENDKEFDWVYLGSKFSGKTWTQPDELEEILENSGEWTNEKYDFINHNCHDFVKECLKIAGANKEIYTKILPVFTPKK